MGPLSIGKLLITLALTLINDKHISWFHIIVSDKEKSLKHSMRCQCDETFFFVTEAPSKLVRAVTILFRLV
jgi:hypothetical protein